MVQDGGLRPPNCPAGGDVVEVLEDPSPPGRGRAQNPSDVIDV